MLALITCLVKHFFKAMKKIIVSTIVALFAITSFTSKGEILTSRSFYKEGPRMTWFVRGGVSLNMVGGDYVKYWKDEDRSFGMKPGFDISAGFERFFGKKNLYWGLELGIGTRGFSAKYETTFTPQEAGECIPEVQPLAQAGKQSADHSDLKCKAEDNPADHREPFRP